MAPLPFPIGNGNGAIYHGKTIIHEIETNERLSVHLKNQETNEVFDATDILPEYFFISVPLFNDRLEKEIDDWLHVMKYDEVPSNYHSPYMSQVAEKLSILKMTPEERARYSYYQKKLYNDRDELQAAVARGEAKGKAEGKAEGKTEREVEIAKNLLTADIDIQVIEQTTGLSKEQINQFK